jgi:glycosyltransferase involved in cell wall biosynthesis
MGVNTQLYSNDSIEVVVAIPAYNESATLPTIVKELSLFLSEKDAILILDDSPFQIQAETQSAVTSAVNNSKCLVIFSHNNGKSGRGAAVRRGMELSIEKFPKLKYFVECDADGSHRVADIVKLKNSEILCDLLVGSRYLKESKIKQINIALQGRRFGWQVLPEAYMYKKFQPTLTFDIKSKTPRSHMQRTLVLRSVNVWQQQKVIKEVQLQHYYVNEAAFYCENKKALNPISWQAHIQQGQEFVKLFEDLPVLFVNDWKDVNQQLLDDTIEKFKNRTFNYDKLTMAYWKNIVFSV